MDFDEAVSSIQGSKDIPTVLAVRILLRKLLFFYSNSKDAQRLVRKKLSILHFVLTMQCTVCCGGAAALWLGHWTPKLSSSPGSSPDWGHCAVFLGETLHSYSASLHPGV